MSPQLLHSSAPITLLGGGSVNEIQLQRALARAPELVAADGGADVAVRAGLIPKIVVGDFDSISNKARSVIPEDRQFIIREQDSTDFEKCLSRVNAPLILGLGFLGARLDHALSAMNALARHPERRCILIGGDDLCFLSPPRLELPLPVGTRLSLFPVTPATGDSQGLRWPIAGIPFSPGGRIGTSNEVTGPVSLRIDAGAMLVILPEAHLDLAAEALMAGAAAGG